MTLREYLNSLSDEEFANTVFSTSGCSLCLRYTTCEKESEDFDSFMDNIPDCCSMIQRQILLLLLIGMRFRV